MSDLVICCNCGWVHFAIDNKHISDWKVEWDKFWPTLDDAGKDMYGLLDGPPTPEEYYQCFRCGGDYKNMRDLTLEDKFGDGHTVQGILGRQYERNKDWDTDNESNNKN